jgi:hypothetical protein
MKKITVYTILFFVVLSSCKKKEPLPQEESQAPVFYASFSVDGQAQRIEAGNDNYYMNTSWSQDTTDNIYRFTGNLSQTSYPNGRGYGLTIIINDNRPSAHNANVNTDSVLKLGRHLLNDEIISGTTQKLNFTPLNGNDGVYNWTISDGQATNQTFNTYTASSLLDVGKTYSVSLNYISASGACLNKSHTNVFKVGSKLQSNITTTSTADTFTFGYTVPSGITPSLLTCNWDFGDATSSSIPHPTHTFANLTEYVVKLTLNYQSETCTSYYKANAANPSCHANFNTSFDPVPTQTNYSTVTVLLTDKDGVVYSSREEVQPGSSFFNIVSSNDYQNNSSGFPTKSLRLNFNCLVKNGNKTITLSGGDAVIAVAHK